MMIRCILMELLECKFHKDAGVSTFRTLRCDNSVRTHQITMVIRPFFINIRCTVGSYELIFNWTSSNSTNLSQFDGLFFERYRELALVFWLQIASFNCKNEFPTGGGGGGGCNRSSNKVFGSGTISLSGWFSFLHGQHQKDPIKIEIKSVQCRLQFLICMFLSCGFVLYVTLQRFCWWLYPSY